MPFACSPVEIMGWIEGVLVNTSTLKKPLSSVSVSQIKNLRDSQEADLAFFFSPEFKNELPFSRAGILVIGEAFVEPLLKSGLPLLQSTAIIACRDPYRAMGLISEKFAMFLSSGAHLEMNQTKVIHETAIVGAGVVLDEGVQIGAYCVIEDGCHLRRGVVIYPGCYLGRGVTIGEGTVLFARVSLYEGTSIGRQCRIHAGAVIGADGFGYAPVVEEKEVKGHQKIYHLGRVLIGDQVEVGANSTIDRGTFGDTVIENQVKIDNLVQIGHNCHIKEGSILCGESGMAGSSELGRFCYVGGMAGIGNKVIVGDRANVAACTLVTKDVAPGSTVCGNPMREVREHFKAHALINRLLKQEKRKNS